MYRKAILLIFVALILIFVGNAGAASVWWYGTVNDNWNNPNNYSVPGAMPPTGPDLSTAINWSVSGKDANPILKLDPGETGYCSSFWSYAEFGGTYEAVININGGTLISSGNCTAGTTDTDNDSTINVSPGSSVTFPVYTRIGRELASSTGVGKIHMTGGTWDTGSLEIPYSGNGRLELYGGTMEADSLSMGANGMIDITQGTLKISGDKTADVNNFKTNGWLKAYDGVGTLIIKYIGGFTIVTATDPGVAGNPYPDDESQDVSPNIVLSWDPGAWADKHYVYFGTDSNNLQLVTDVTQPQGPNIYSPDNLDMNQTYYWQIDETDAGEVTTWPGETWSFTTGQFKIVDDMESYNDSTNLISSVWTDGQSASTSGSVISLQQGTNVRGGIKSMRYAYNNDGMAASVPYYSQVEANTVDLQCSSDWTANDVKALYLWYKAESDNDAEQMYIAIEDTNDNIAVVNHPDPDAALNQSWTNWAIDLQDFSGVNLANIKKVYLGFGNIDSHPTPGGSGVVYFDDFRLYQSVCIEQPQYDFNGDCVVDFKDFTIFANGWQPF